MPAKYWINSATLLKPHGVPHAGEQGRICVGITPTSPFHPFVPRIIRAFRDAFPQVSMRLEERFGSKLIEQPRTEQVDAAFVRMPLLDPPEGLVVNRLWPRLALRCDRRRLI